ncbi:unnamed protein product [Adineta steineri]|uniref:Golgi apparatus membrane protein TVP23 homolog n=1 Tax=Adineta steineri TaxID=433720 RepID=A0A815WXZ0_9BILA|nr:unnamed protein product [Adineta steineri]CAF1659552.1 unnamed protein product [Adineta steineri]
MAQLLSNEEEVLEAFDPSIAASRRFKHPIAVFFHMAFRSLAIVAYFMCSWAKASFVTSFVIIIVLLSMDFWTVKNITGRLLAGLRYWNYVDDAGNNHWIFESKKGTDKSTVSPIESNIFWLSLVFTILLWILLTITTLFSPTYIIITGAALALNVTNLYGFVRCKFGSNEKLSDEMKKTVFKSFLSRVTSGAGGNMPSSTDNEQQQSSAARTMFGP